MKSEPTFHTVINSSGKNGPCMGPNRKWVHIGPTHFFYFGGGEGGGGLCGEKMINAIRNVIQNKRTMT